MNDHADQVLAQLQSGARQDQARRIFQQLTEVGEGRERRRPARLSKLAGLTGAVPAEVKTLVEHFFQANFLTSPDRGTTSAGTNTATEIAKTTAARLRERM